jgi:hypothetical protein
MHNCIAWPASLTHCPAIAVPAWLPTPPASCSTLVDTRHIAYSTSPPLLHPAPTPAAYTTPVVILLPQMPLPQPTGLTCFAAPALPQEGIAQHSNTTPAVNLLLRTMLTQQPARLDAPIQQVVQCPSVLGLLLASCCSASCTPAEINQQCHHQAQQATRDSLLTMDWSAGNNVCPRDTHTTPPLPLPAAATCHTGAPCCSAACTMRPLVQPRLHLTGTTHERMILFAVTPRLQRSVPLEGSPAAPLAVARLR